MRSAIKISGVNMFISCSSQVLKVAAKIALKATMAIRSCSGFTTDVKYCTNLSEFSETLTGCIISGM